MNRDEYRRYIEGRLTLRAQNLVGDMDIDDAFRHGIKPEVAVAMFNGCAENGVSGEQCMDLYLPMKQWLLGEAA